MAIPKGNQSVRVPFMYAVQEKKLTPGENQQLPLHKGKIEQSIEIYMESINCVDMQRQEIHFRHNES